RLGTEHEGCIAKTQFRMNGTLRTIHHAADCEPQSILVEVHRSTDIANGEHRSQGAILFAIEWIDFRSCWLACSGPGWLRRPLFCGFCGPRCRLRFSGDSG